MPEARLFLERKSYRRRRIMDVVRMLPLVCALLWMVVPTMWPNGAAEGAQTRLSTALWYLFAVWCVAIAASFALWRRVRQHDAQDAQDAQSAHDVQDVHDVQDTEGAQGVPGARAQQAGGPDTPQTSGGAGGGPAD